MNYKKLLATAVFTLGAWMSVGVAQAQTNYDFSTTINGFSYAATFSSSTPGILDGIVSSVYGAVDVITFTVPDYPYPTVGTYSDSGTGAVLTGISLYFRESDAEGSIYYGIYGGPDQTKVSRGSLPSQLYTYIDIPDNAALTNYTFAIAPEMNASFIPQVGLLLGCLFFLMGRKREVVEPMMTA